MILKTLFVFHVEQSLWVNIVNMQKMKKEEKIEFFALIFDKLVSVNKVQIY
tara:strand:- start:368 stop:520 length:153 start_codon:yes stop_codon:yes gene_type:complete